MKNFAEDGNDVYTITQWFPRMCVYSDFQGWHFEGGQNHPFLKRFFGNYKVSMNVPSDYVIGEQENVKITIRF